MTTFHAFLGCSLDGFIAAPGGDLQWLSDFDESLGDTEFDEFFDSIDALVMGRTTYETMRGFDPQVYKGVPIHVLSTTMAAGPRPGLGASAVTVHADIPSVRAELDEAGVRRAYADGGRTVQAFLKAGLLTDIVITRVPVLIGDGIPLFGSLPSPVHATLVGTRRLDAGAVQSTYRFGPPEPTPDDESPAASVS
jgi:dihydrofolate reductase